MSAAEPPQERSRARIVVAAAVIERDGRLLVTRRLDGTHLAGLWEFPGGKQEPGETLEDALVRELGEELDVRARVGDRILMTAHDYPARCVELHFFACRIDGEPRAVHGQDMRWVTRPELESLEFPQADAELIALLVGEDRPPAGH